VQAVGSVALSPDGRHVASASNLDGTARLWDVKTGKEIKRFEGHKGGVHQVAFSPDGGRVLSGCADGTARLWDVESGQEVKRFAGHSREVLWVAFSPDGWRVFTGSYDNTVRAWDVQPAKDIRQFNVLNP